MPELVECLSHYLLASSLFNKYADSDWHLRNLWYDGTATENQSARANDTMKEGRVGIVHPGTKALRGSGSAQGPLWPPTLSNSSELQQLKLQGISYTYRALILDLGGMWLQVCCMSLACRFGSSYLHSRSNT